MFNSVRLNKEFHDQIIGSIPDNFDSLEKAYYVYCYLCYHLTYDPEVYYKDVNNCSTVHNKIERIEEINKDNNKIVCYEFSAIYGKILEELGIRYEICGGDEYGNSHLSLNIFTNDFVIDADPLNSQIYSDLAKMKNGLELSGFIFKLPSDINELIAKRKKFNDSIKKVNDYFSIQFNYYHGTISELGDYTKLDFDERLSTFLKLIMNSNLCDVSKISYVLEAQSKIFYDEYNSSVCVAGDELDKSLVFIVAYNDRGVYGRFDNDYYLVKNDHFDLYSKEEIIREFDSGRLVVSNSRNIFALPGVDLVGFQYKKKD